LWLYCCSVKFMNNSCPVVRAVLPVGPFCFLLDRGAKENLW